MTTTDPADASDGPHLRLVFPQWQGGGMAAFAIHAAEFPLEVARRGYAVGATVLAATLPPHHGPTATVPVTMTDDGTETNDGIEAKAILTAQLADALHVINQHDPTKITTLGGDCSVSIAPFTALAHRYGDDLAVLWIDSHPDVGTSASDYPGYHAMAVSAITGHGDPDIEAILPAVVSPSHVALVGVHAWTDDDYPNISTWGLSSFSPDDLRHDTNNLLDWLARSGCTRVAIHLDVDVIDSNQMFLGLGAIPAGLTGPQVRRIINDISTVVEVVGLTIAEFIPRQVIQLGQMLTDLPLLEAINTGPEPH